MMVAHRNAPVAEALAQGAVARLRPLIARAAAVINGSEIRAAERRGPQGTIDAIFGG
jgi:hypothetical protein